MQGIIRTIRDGRGFDILLRCLALVFLLRFPAFPLIYNVIMCFRRSTCSRSARSSAPLSAWRTTATFSRSRLPRPFCWNTVIFVVLSIAGSSRSASGLRCSSSRFSRRLLSARPVPRRMDYAGARRRRHLELDPCRGFRRPQLRADGTWHHRQCIFWLSDPNVALYAVIIANIWLGIAFNMILLSVGPCRHSARSLRGGRTRWRQSPANASGQSPCL